MKSRRTVEIKGSALPVLRVVVRDGEAGSLQGEIASVLTDARPLLAEAIAVLDLRERESRAVAAREITQAVRDTGVRLAAVMIADADERGELVNLDLPVIEAPIVANDRAAVAQREVEPSKAEPASAEPQADEVQLSTSAPLAPMLITRPVRSGQRIYAQGRDLVVTAPTSAGSELIADGSIYAFSPVRGRVLAGASGNVNACIVASQLDAELIAIAGIYRTLEAGELHDIGPAVSVALAREADGTECLTLSPLGPALSVRRT